MLPYLLLLGAPAGAAIIAIRRSVLLMLAIALLYWFLIGFRFHIGADWDNYILIYLNAERASLGALLTRPEPGFGALLWLSSALGGGPILVNAISALVFCWGFFALARRCREPFLAICVATPLVVVAMAMSGIRQATAMGIIYYLFATWEKRSLVGRTIFIFVGTLFHSSALFTGVFVALSSRLSGPARLAVASLIPAVMLAVMWLLPGRFEYYAEVYAGAERMTAPGALAHIAVLAAPAALYLALRSSWHQAIGRSLLVEHMAIVSILLLPAVLISSVGASRFSLYLWPVAMYVWSGIPGLIRSQSAQFIYRVAVVIGSVLLLVAWLEIANTSWAYLPYENWLWQPERTPLMR